MDDTNVQAPVEETAEVESAETNVAEGDNDASAEDVEESTDE